MMKVRYDRITRAQALMAREGLHGLMIMNYDDYRYFFGEARAQPRAIIPVAGPPILIAFWTEEPELREALSGEPVRIFKQVGEQISDVNKAFRELLTQPPPPGFQMPEDGRPRVGMQMWFHTPAFLVDLFRQVNPRLALVSSDPVMDELRMVKEPEEVELLQQAQSIAARGMDRAREVIRPGATSHEVATEVLYTMMKAGASGTSTPLYVNSGIRTCWAHGTTCQNPIQAGDLVFVDLTPQYAGYCANLSRTFVVGEPAAWQQHLRDTYLEMKAATVAMLQPGARVADLDARGKEICAARGLAENHVEGISHGIGLRFEETPASTIIKQHRQVVLREGMTVTAGHTPLALPGQGGVRYEDIYRVTPRGGELLHSYPVEEWILPA